MGDTSGCVGCDTYVDILSYYSILLIIFGTLGNLFASYICYRPSLQKVSTFRILTVLFIYEIFSLYTWNLDIFLKLFRPNSKGVGVSIDDINIIESLNLVTCKIFTFMQYYSLQCISWFLMYISVDQCVKLYFPNSRYARKIKNVYRVCLGISTIIFFINVHILLFVGKIKVFSFNTTIGFNETQKISEERLECYNSDLYDLHPFWDQFHLYIYAIGPFCITIIFNCFIFKKLFDNNSSVNKVGQQKKRKLVITILIISFLFIICALPQVIAFGFFFVQLSATYVGSVILPTCDLINFTFNAFNFMLYFGTNIVFRNECIHQIKKLGIILSFWFCKPFSSQARFAEIRENYKNRNNQFYNNQTSANAQSTARRTTNVRENESIRK